MGENIFIQISVLLVVTVCIAYIVRLLKQPLIIAYIIAGIVCGPLFLGLLEGQTETYNAFAKFGVILLLFVLGMSLNFNYLRKIGLVALTTGIGQVIFTFIVGALILLALSFDFSSSLYLAMAITFSSTIIITKLLSDKGDEGTIYGKNTIGLMLVQDVIAILIMIIVTTSGQGSSITSSLGLLVIKGVVLVIFLYFASKYFLSYILDTISDSGEFLFIFTLSWCFAIASLVSLFGFSVEIGAIAAGLTLGSSPYQAEIISRIKPLRDFFIVLFFVILGSEIGLVGIDGIVIPGLVLALFILIGNPLILYIFFRLSKFTRRNSFLAGLTAAQVSEFGFILLFTGQQAGHIQDEKVLAVFTFVALLTIFASSYLITYNSQIYELVAPLLEKFGKKDAKRQRNAKRKKFDVWVLGCHQMGWKACCALLKKKHSFAAVDINPRTVKKLQRLGVEAFYGDIADVELLESLPLNDANLVIVTAPDPSDQKTLVSYLQKLKNRPMIISNLHHYKHRDDLYDLGVDYIVMPHLLGGNWIAEIIQNRRWTKLAFKRLRKLQQEELESEFS